MALAVFSECCMAYGFVAYIWGIAAAAAAALIVSGLARVGAYIEWRLVGAARLIGESKVGE